MPKKYNPVPLSPSQVTEALTVSRLAIRHIAETGDPAAAELGDVGGYLRTLTRLTEGVKAHGLPPSLSGRGASQKG